MDKFNDAYELSCDDWVNNFSASYDYEFSKSFDKKMNKLIDKMRSDKYHKLTKKSMQALIIAAIILSLATTVFAIPSSREYALKQFRDHFSYSVAETDDVVYIDSITVGYIPDGFKKSSSNESEVLILYEYENNEKWFTIIKNTINAEINFNSENRIIKNINGIEYILSSNDSTNGVIWNNGLYTYSISGNIDKEELFNIALEVE